MIDIGADECYPAKELSNFNQYPFAIDGVSCASMEGFLQSLKFWEADKQREICALWGGNAKKRGSRKNKRWKKDQTLYWQGQCLKRESQEYQALLNHAFTCLWQNEDYRKAVLATGDEELTHSFGRTEMTETVLTIDEFCSRIIQLRENGKLE